MEPNLFNNARLFIYRNARLLERRVFETLFEDGSREGVVQALKAYQNSDGGFGNALEPDKRAPSSQPLDVQFALEVLDRCGMLTDPEVKRDLLLPACGFLATVTAPDGGVACVSASVNAYPHAPWWQVDELKAPAGPEPHRCHRRAVAEGRGGTSLAGRGSGFLQAGDREKRGGLVPHADLRLDLPGNVPERAWAGAQQVHLEERLRKPGVIEMDPDAGGYVQMPLDWAPTPHHFARRLFDEAAIALHLNALRNRQQPDGGWPITWDPISPAVGMEWRGIGALNALVTLRAYEEAYIK